MICLFLFFVVVHFLSIKSQLTLEKRMGTRPLYAKFVHSCLCTNSTHYKFIVYLSYSTYLAYKQKQDKNSYCHYTSRFIVSNFLTILT